jgi:hypothetical protein
MQLKIAKRLCFLIASIFLLIFIAFNSCKKVDDTNQNPVIPRVDSTKNSVDTTKNTDTSKTIVTARLLDSSGKALSNAPCIFISYNLPNSGFEAFSDSLGNVKIILDKNTSYILRVSQSLNCGTFNYSKNFTTVDINLDLGNLVIKTDATSYTVTGTVVDCNNNLVKTGNIILEEYNYQDRNNIQSSINPDGTFKLTFTVCKTDSVPVIIYAEDPSGQQIGNRIYFSLHSPENNIGKITACTNTDTSQFLKITIDTSEYIYSFVDNSNSHPEAGLVWTYITGQNQMTGPFEVNFGIDGFLAVGKPNLSLVQFDIEPKYSEADSPPFVVITEDGPIGGYIAGNIKLKLETLDDTHSIHDATCIFRVKRKQ